MCVGYTVIQVDKSQMAGKPWVLVQRPGGVFYMLVPIGQDARVPPEATRMLAEQIAEELAGVG